MDNFNRTITCLIAEQIYTSGLSYRSEANFRYSLTQQSACLPVSQRCSTMPVEKCPRDLRYATSNQLTLRFNIRPSLTDTDP